MPHVTINDVRRPAQPRYQARVKPLPLNDYGIEVNDFPNIADYFKAVAAQDAIAAERYEQERQEALAEKWDGKTAEDLATMLEEALVLARKEDRLLAVKVREAAELAGVLGHVFAPDLARLRSRVSSVSTMSHGYTVHYAEKFSYACVALTDMLRLVRLERERVA